MADSDPDRLADAAEREVDGLEERSQRLEAEIDGARQDWERKRVDDGVPGAPPPAKRDA